MATTTLDIYNQFVEVLNEGDEGKARQFLVDKFAEFPEEVQGEILTGFFEEALDRTSADENLVAQLDERRIKQVLLNLISNAINYSPAGGQITISAVRTKDSLRLGVRDTGMGIPAADLARVFTPFEKIHSKTVQRRSGAGLGLALVKNIVELHGGTVEIESHEGVGTLVTCVLPQK